MMHVHTLQLVDDARADATRSWMLQFLNNLDLCDATSELN